jgi:hypothetical protein
MTAGLERIEEYFQAFREAIGRCRSAAAFQAADWQDAYARLSRLRDRYLKEREALAPSERNALMKVFEQDTFIEGMMDMRQVGEHVIKRGGPVIRTTSNVPITLDVQTSAKAMYAAPQVNLVDVRGDPHRIDHLKLLQEAEKRIDAALRNARP